MLQSAKNLELKKRQIWVAFLRYKKKKENLFGKMQGTIHILKDIVPPTDEIWDASR